MAAFVGSDTTNDPFGLHPRNRFLNRRPRPSRSLRQHINAYRRIVLDHAKYRIRCFHTGFHAGFHTGFHTGRDSAASQRGMSDKRSIVDVRKPEVVWFEAKFRHRLYRAGRIGDAELGRVFLADRIGIAVLVAMARALKCPPPTPPA